MNKITPTEARLISNQELSALQSRTLQLIYDNIRLQASKGKLTYLHVGLYDPVIHHQLESEGYSVLKRGGQMPNNDLFISWDVNNPTDQIVVPSHLH